MDIMVTTQVAVIMVLMVVDITPKEVKVAVVTIPREVSLNGNILPCISDTTTEYRVESTFVILALLVLILMISKDMMDVKLEEKVAMTGLVKEGKVLAIITKVCTSHKCNTSLCLCVNKIVLT